MRVVVQKCLNASVTVDGQVINQIDNGLMLLVGFTKGDDHIIIDKLVNKIIKLRIFEDNCNVMNLSITDVNGSILAISQFTLYGDAKKGNRPSYINALNGELAKPLYEYFINKLNESIPTFGGVFGADMKVSLVNDGPTTILLDSVDF